LSKERHALGSTPMTAPAAKSDLELLEEYAQSGGEAPNDGSALAPLVKRYIDLVYSAALRQVRDARLAREVTLAVFYILIQKGKRTGKTEPLACRLYRMTRFASVHAIKREGRKRRRSQTLEPPEPAPPLDLPAWDEISDQLDAGIMGLGEMDRTTLILHYFQHEVLGNVAAALGVPESVARERLFGAVGRLREDLAARDLNVAVADVFSSLASHAAHRAPARMVEAIVEMLSRRSIDADTKDLARKTSRTMKRPSMYSVLCSVALILFSTGLAWAILRHDDRPMHARFTPHATAPVVEMSTRLRKSQEETYLEYVDSQRYVNSVIGAISTALRSEGEKVPYEQAMGYSGAAFRFAIREPDWCPSSPFSLDRADDLMKAAGRTMTVVEKPAEATNLAKTQSLIVNSIDQVRPVLFLQNEAGLITGYRRNGKQFLCRPYNFDGDRTPLFDWGIASIGVISPKTSRLPTSRPETIRRSLELALELSKSPHTKKDTDGQFLVFGLEGWQLWIDQLSEFDRFTDYNPDKYKETMTANAWMLASLIDARTASANYLRWAVGKVPSSPALAMHLNKAAGLYESVARTLEPAKKLAPYPWTIPTVEWTEELRKQQAGILAEALKSEKQALSEIAAALAMGPTTAPTTQP